jgi:hypothetical protein
MEKIVVEYEDRSAITCEITGTPGVMMRRGGWFRTLNPDHAPEGYEVVEVEEED